MTEDAKNFFISIYHFSGNKPWHATYKIFPSSEDIGLLEIKSIIKTAVEGVNMRKAIYKGISEEVACSFVRINEENDEWVEVGNVENPLIIPDYNLGDDD